MGHDVIVLGCGGVGSAALAHLAGRGLDVVGIDRFAPGHDRGSSHGHTRVTRTAYYEHPDYVPLLQRAWTLWDELVERTGERLLLRTGVVEMGPPDGDVVPGVREAAARHDLAVEELTTEEAAERFPGIVVPDGCDVLFEEQAGILLVEDCVRAHARVATDAGGTLLTDTVVTGWEATPGAVRVTTEDGVLEADRLVVTAGAWAGPLLGELGVPLQPLRKQLQWYEDHDPSYAVEEGFPVFFAELPHGTFYGFPSVDGQGFKIAEHSGGRPLDDPLALDRSLDAEEQARCDEVVAHHFPGVHGPATRHAACMYTMTPDQHFVVDHHPVDERVVFAAGLSGHGFKFASSLGELLADLAVDGSSTLPHAFLGLGPERVG